MEVTFVFIFVGISLVLLLAELVIPSAGVLGIMSAISMVAAVVAAFFVNQWAGLGLLAGVIVVAPFAFKLLFAIWQRTPMGRQVVLTATLPPVQVQRIALGETGTTVSALRPMGEANFGALRIQVTSDSGPIPAGAIVVVVGSKDDVAIVRTV